MPVVEFHFTMTARELGTYIKEFSAELVQRDIGILEMEVTKHVDLE